MSNPNAPFTTGGGFDSRQAKWMEFMDEYQLRRREVEFAIQERRQQVECFERVMGMLREENAQYCQLIRKKYLEKVSPDRSIWEGVLFVGKTKFYDMRRYVVESFFDCLPGEFKGRTKSEPKTA